MQETRKKIPVRSLQKKRMKGAQFDTLRIKSWSKSLKIPGQPEQKSDESVICSSFPPSTFSQPNFNKIAKRMSRSSSVAPVSPYLSLAERLLQSAEEKMKETPEQRKIIKQQQILESTQSQSCPVLPLVSTSPRKKLGRTQRSKSAIEKLGSQIQKKEVKERQEEITKLPPPFFESAQIKPANKIIGIVDGQEELILPPRPSTPPRQTPQRSYSICLGKISVNLPELPPPPVNMATKPKPKTSQTS